MCLPHTRTPLTTNYHHSHSINAALFCCGCCWFDVACVWFMPRIDGVTESMLTAHSKRLDQLSILYSSRTGEKYAAVWNAIRSNALWILCEKKKYNRHAQQSSIEPGNRLRGQPACVSFSLRKMGISVFAGAHIRHDRVWLPFGESCDQLHNMHMPNMSHMFARHLAIVHGHRSILFTSMRGWLLAIHIMLLIL